MLKAWGASAKAPKRWDRKEPSEDAFALVNNVFVVADGIGSFENSARASRQTAEDLVAVLSAREERSLAARTLYSHLMLPRIAERVKEVSGSGSTGLGVSLKPAAFGLPIWRFICISVGDSRLYAINAAMTRATCLTTDHVLVEKSERGKERTLLMNWFGAGFSVMPNMVFTGNVPAGGFLLLATDGLWRSFERDREHVFAALRSAPREGTKWPALSALVQTAAERTGDDATGILIHCG